MQGISLKQLPTLLIEDDQLTREACHTYLMSLGLAVEVAETYDRAVQIIDEKVASFHLVIADLSLRREGELRLRKPNALGLGLIRQLKQRSPATPVVIWTAYPDLTANVVDLILQGYRGLACVPKGNTVDVLHEAILRVLEGDVVFEVGTTMAGSVQERFLSALEPETAQAVLRLSNRIELLTERQREIVNLLICTTDVIAKRLSLSLHTVRNYCDKIYERLGLKDELRDSQRDTLIVLAVLLRRLHNIDH